MKKYTPAEYCDMFHFCPQESEEFIKRTHLPPTEAINIFTLATYAQKYIDSGRKDGLGDARRIILAANIASKGDQKLTIDEISRVFGPSVKFLSKYLKKEVAYTIPQVIEALPEESSVSKRLSQGVQFLN